MNKRETKHKLDRMKILIKSLEINQTCLALTNGLCDDEFFESNRIESEELKNILIELKLAPMKIGESHKIWKMEI